MSYRKINRSLSTTLLTLAAIAAFSQSHVGINALVPSYTLDIYSTSPTDPPNLQLSTSDSLHFLRLFAGHGNDPRPFVLFSKQDTFRIATSTKDFGDFTERLTILPNGKTGIGSFKPLNRLQVHNSVAVQSAPPFATWSAQPTYVQITNGLSGGDLFTGPGVIDSTKGLRLGVNQFGNGQIIHPSSLAISTGNSKISMNGLYLVLDSTVYISGKTISGGKTGVNAPNVIPEYALDVHGKMRISDDADSPQAGNIRFNATTNDFEGYDGTKWRSLTKVNTNWGVFPTTNVFENQKAIASDVDTTDYFGYSIDIDGDYAVVGAYGDDNSKGSAYIFIRSGNAWSQQAKLTATDGIAGDLFGFSVGISGDACIVGAYHKAKGGTMEAGAAYIYHRIGSSWIQQYKFNPSDAIAGGHIGYSVGISGNYAIVGAPGDDDNGTASGSAYLLLRSGTVWSQQDKISGTDTEAQYQFGYHVAISGDYAVASVLYVGSGSGSNNVYVFKRDITDWYQQDSWVNAGGTTSDIDIHGDYVIAGAAFASVDALIAQGIAEIHKRTGATWNPVDTLIAPYGMSGDHFGYRVAIEGNLVVVGAINASGTIPGQGVAYLMTGMNDNWTVQNKLIASDGRSLDLFGHDVALSATTAIVGAYGDDTGTNVNAGSIYFFSK